LIAASVSTQIRLFSLADVDSSGWLAVERQSVTFVIEETSLVYQARDGKCIAISSQLQAWFKREWDIKRKADEQSQQKDVEELELWCWGKIWVRFGDKDKPQTPCEINLQARDPRVVAPSLRKRSKTGTSFE
jgi:hypothetical protein